MIFPGERILSRTFAFLHPRLQVAAVKEYMTAYAVLALLLAVLLLTACDSSIGEDTKTETLSTQTPAPTRNKALVVYFSAQGHTKTLAETMAKAIGVESQGNCPRRTIHGA